MSIETPAETVTGTDTLSIDIDCPPPLAEYLGQVLWGVGGIQSVMELYSNPNAAETTPDDLDVIRVFANPSPEIPEQIRLVLASDSVLTPCKIKSLNNLKEEDWAEHWKKYWHMTRITDRMTICPSWERANYQPKDGELVLEMDPGAAFGTGAHGTTSLMLKALERLSTEKDFSQCSLLDVGTGSGILAIAAAKLGCKNITAIDICPNSVTVTKDNARINGVSEAITASDTPLHELCQTKHDIVLANIIAPVILALMPDMAMRLTSDGVIILSGLIKANLPEIELALKAHGLSVVEQQQEGDWYAIIAKR